MSDLSPASKIRRWDARRLVGVTLIAAPFIGIAAFVYHEEGIQLVIVAFGITALIVGLIVVGVTMLFK